MLDIIIVFLVFGAALGLAWHFTRPKDVPITDEFKARYAPESAGKKALYVLTGILTASLAAYGVTGQIHLALLAAPGGLFIARLWEKRRQAARVRLLRSQYGHALAVLSSALQGGLSPYQAFEDAVPSMPRPARDVFSEILRRTRTGSTFVEATEAVARESGWKDLDSLAVALRIYSKTGCNLVEVFGHLLESVYEKANDEKYLAAVTAETRMTAMLLSFLPFFLMGVSRVMAPEFVRPLFETVGGNAVIVLCVLMVLTGNWVTGKMVSRVVGDS